MRGQSGAGPLPQATDVGLAAETRAVGDWRGVPLAEGDVAGSRVDEEGVRVWTGAVAVAVTAVVGGGGSSSSSIT